MIDSIILTVMGDGELLTLLQKQLHDQSGRGARLVVAATIDEACSLLATVRPRLVVVNLSRHGVHYEELDQLLWTTTVLARRIPVVVIADRYRTDQAITLYRMGVAEYISRTHHIDQCGRILGSYLPRSQGWARRTSASLEESGQPVKTWSFAAPPTVAARVI